MPQPNETKYSIKRYSGIQKLTHRKIVEDIIGRELRPDEVVHHIDGNKANNNPSNLMLMKKSRHQSLHATERQNNKRNKASKELNMNDCKDEFLSGVWWSIQYLVNIGETCLAGQIAKESGYTSADFRKEQKLTDYNNDIMYPFILKELIVHRKII